MTFNRQPRVHFLPLPPFFPPPNVTNGSDGVLAAKLQEASLAALAAVDRDSKEQGIQLQCVAPVVHCSSSTITT